MRKQELIQRYRQGERSFRKQNLSGLSLAGQNFSGADFSGSDIRGTDFTSAILRGTNFSEVQAGLQKSEVVLLLLFLALAAILLGVAAGFVGTLLNLELRAFTSSFEEVTAGWAMVVLLLAFAVLSVTEGITTGFSAFVVAFGLAVLVAAVGPIFSTVINPIAFALAAAVALAITIMSSVTLLTVLATVVAIAALRAFGLRAAVGMVALYLGLFSYIVSITNIVTSVVPVVPAVMLLSSYLGWQALEGNPRHRLILRTGDLLVSRWGTNFREANLTSANFSNVNLKNVNFDEANLTRVCWTGASSGRSIVLSGTN
ncbi:MAG: pentapeptide repeat-containing protein [Elainella sp.]